MRFSEFFIKTLRQYPETGSANAQLLNRAGFISQSSSGVYTLLPLALRTISKIERIIDEQMTALGASRILMPALQPLSLWQKTGRDKTLKTVLYLDEQKKDVFAPTHEELLTELLSKVISSYRDLPVLLYQIQTKYRRELRAKSGLLRSREFIMKDLYSFHPDNKSFHSFYEKASQSYFKIFEKLGLEVYRVKAGGGGFTEEFSDEFQVLCEAGEDEIFYNPKTKTGYNKEVEKSIPRNEKKSLRRARAIELGNIFPLGTKFAEDLNLTYLSLNGTREHPVMGSYGIGITRALAALAEIYHDSNGLIWPSQVAPFEIYFIDLTHSGEGERVYKQLNKDWEVLFDDREESPGVKFAEADLIGLPLRIVYSAKLSQEGKIELKGRQSDRPRLVNIDELDSAVAKFFKGVGASG